MLKTHGTREVTDLVLTVISLPYTKGSGKNTTISCNEPPNSIISVILKMLIFLADLIFYVTEKYLELYYIHKPRFPNVKHHLNHIKPQEVFIFSVGTQKFVHKRLIKGRQSIQNDRKC